MGTVKPLSSGASGMKRSDEGGGVDPTIGESPAESEGLKRFLYELTPWADRLNTSNEAE